MFGGHGVGEIGRERVGPGSVGDRLHESFARIPVDAYLDDAEHTHPACDQVNEGAFLELHSCETIEQHPQVGICSMYAD